MANIQPAHIDNVLDRASGLSPKTIRNLVALLHSVFAVALDKDFIEKSPVRNSHRPTVEDREKPIWTAEQIQQILDGVEPEFRVLFSVIALLGLRLGEALALQWRHVDFERRQLRIEQSLWRSWIVTTKTKRSKATIPLGNGLARLLTSHLEGSKHIGPKDFVFCDAKGLPLDPGFLRKDVLHPVLDRLEIPRDARNSGFYRFRHSAGSLVYDATGNLKTTQSLLRHAQLSTTMNVYTHAVGAADKVAVEALEAVLLDDSKFGYI